MTDSATPTVLVVDDSLELTRQVARFLRDRRPSWQVLEANDGVDATELLELVECDVVLCDVQMPPFNGPQVLEAIARVRPEQAQRFVFMTGFITSEHRANLAELSGHRVLDKPIDYADMLDLLDRLMERLPARARMI
jgi:two-component system response regulator YesN